MIGNLAGEAGEWFGWCLAVLSLDQPFEVDPDEVTAEFEPLPEAQRQLGYFAERALHITRAAVVVALDLAADEACLALAGHYSTPDSEQEAWLTLWLQVADTTSLATVPPRLRGLLPAEKALVMPIVTPGGRLGVVAVSPPCTSRRTLRQLEALAEDLGLELELRERREHDSRPPPAVELVA